MISFTENIFISEFNVRPDGQIAVRKTTEVIKTVDGQSTVLSTSHWRCVLPPSATVDTTILNEPYYANLAQQAWTPAVVAAYEAAQAARAASVAQTTQPAGA